MKVKKSFTAEETKANVIRYMVYDMLCDLPDSGKFDLNMFEKEVLKILLDDNKNWENKKVVDKGEKA